MGFLGKRKEAQEGGGPKWAHSCAGPRVGKVVCTGGVGAQMCAREGAQVVRVHRWGWVHRCVHRG